MAKGQKRSGREIRKPKATQPKKANVALQPRVLERISEGSGGN